MTLRGVTAVHRGPALPSGHRAPRAWVTSTPRPPPLGTGLAAPQRPHPEGSRWVPLLSPQDTFIRLSHRGPAVALGVSGMLSPAGAGHAYSWGDLSGAGWGRYGTVSVSGAGSDCSHTGAANPVAPQGSLPVKKQTEQDGELGKGGVAGWTDRAPPCAGHLFTVPSGGKDRLARSEGKPARTLEGPRGGDQDWPRGARPAR